jgi:hypothetical protein
MREDAGVAVRLARRIAALRTSALRRAPSPGQAAPTLAPITPPPVPSVSAPLYHAPDPTAQVGSRSEYYWEKVVRRADGSLKDWQAQRKAAIERYLQGEKGKAARAAARARYAQSDKGKTARARYAQSDKGKAARVRAQAAYRARKLAAQAYKED